jgi:biotin operon repressor
MILSILQEDATIPVAEIGRRVGLSTTPCWRRIQKMEEEGVIIARAACARSLPKVNAKGHRVRVHHDEPAQRGLAYALSPGSSASIRKWWNSTG